MWSWIESVHNVQDKSCDQTNRPNDRFFSSSNCFKWRLHGPAGKFEHRHHLHGSYLAICTKFEHLNIVNIWNVNMLNNLKVEHRHHLHRGYLENCTKFESRLRQLQRQSAYQQPEKCNQPELVLKLVDWWNTGLKWVTSWCLCLQFCCLINVFWSTCVLALALHEGLLKLLSSKLLV